MTSDYCFGIFKLFWYIISFTRIPCKLIFYCDCNCWMVNGRNKYKRDLINKLVLLWAQLTKIYPPLPTSVQPISITKTLLIVPTKNERDPPLFTAKLLIKFQNILRNTTQVIIRHRVKILFSVISSPITLERQKWKSSKMKGILLSSTGKLLIKFQNILRNTTQVSIRHRVKILFSVISSPTTLERQK